PFGVHADGDSQRPPGAAAALWFTPIGISIGCGVRLLFELKSDCKRRRRVEESDSAGKLIQLRGALLFHSARGLNFLARVGAANDLKRFRTSDHTRQYLRLAIGERRVIGKGEPHHYALTMGFLGRNKSSAAGDVDRTC